MENVISWFEIPVRDIDRAQSFYEAVFERELNRMEFPNGLIMATFPTDGEVVSGALCYHPDFYQPSQKGALIYLNANPSIKAYIERVEPAGGQMLVPMTPISPEHGYMAVFIDPEGNRIALHSKG